MTTGKRTASTGLALRSLLAIIVVSLVFTAASAILQLRSRYRRGLDERQEIIDIIDDSYREAVASALFFFDDTQLQLLVQGISLLPYVEAVEIRELQSGEPVTVLRNEAAGVSDADAGSELHEYRLFHSHDNYRREIGTLLVTTSLERFHAQLADQVRIIVVSNLLQIFGFAFVTLLILRRMVFAHLHAISRFFRGLDPADIQGVRLTLHRSQKVLRGPDELDQISESINDMLGRLEHALCEKTTLVHELYHRSGNMVQSIRAILKLQSVKASDVPEIQALVRAADNRILAIALVHQKLYQSGSLSKIAMRSYLTDLAKEIVHSYETAKPQVYLTLDIDETALLIDDAIPCGLVLSEILSNSIQHAFPDGQTGTVEISLHAAGNGGFVYTIADNGIGLSRSIESFTDETIGIPMVLEIVRKQLGGSIAILDGPGTRWRIEFAGDMYEERVHGG